MIEVDNDKIEQFAFPPRVIFLIPEYRRYYHCLDNPSVSFDRAISGFFLTLMPTISSISIALVIITNFDTIKIPYL
jgi:hypothetical protein